MGIHTNFWGPGAWEFLHSITFNYPIHPTSQEKETTRQFFHLLKYILPCERCRQHYTEGIEKIMPIEPHLKNRDTLSRWLVRFHNIVNKRLGKPIMSYQSVQEKYQSMQGQCQIHEINISSCCNSTTTHHRNPNHNHNHNGGGNGGGPSWLYMFVVILSLILTVLFLLYRRCSTVES